MYLCHTSPFQTTLVVRLSHIIWVMDDEKKEKLNIDILDQV